MRRKRREEFFGEFWEKKGIGNLKRKLRIEERRVAEESRTHSWEGRFPSMTICSFVYFPFFSKLSRSDSQWSFMSACWVVLFWWLLIKYWKILLCFMPYSDEYFSILTHWMLDPWMKWWNGSDVLVKVFMFFFLSLPCYLLVFFSSLSAYSRLPSLGCFPWSFKPWPPCG